VKSNSQSYLRDKKMSKEVIASKGGAKFVKCSGQDVWELHLWKESGETFELVCFVHPRVVKNITEKEGGDTQ